MSEHDQVRAFMDNLLQKLLGLQRYIKETAAEEIQSANEAIYKEYGKSEQAMIEKLFKKSVAEWYSSYSPSVYRRTRGLYDVLKPVDERSDEYGMAITEATGYTDLFDPERLHEDRNGNSLFEKVFMQGWHGGAEDIDGSKADKWGRHPSPGTPYYRRGGMVPLGNGRVIWHKYGRWGRQAIQTESPASRFAKKFGLADTGELDTLFHEIEDKHLDLAEERIQEKVDQYIGEIFR